MEQTFWNGIPTEAVQGSGVVAPALHFPRYWAKRDGIVGQRIALVRVQDHRGGYHYLDDRTGSGWQKVTTYRGSPQRPHRDVEIVPESWQSFRP